MSLGTKRSISEMENSSTCQPPKFVVFTSDAFIDGRGAVANVITKLFSLLKPELQPLPTKSEILQVYAKSPQTLSGIFAQLGHTIESQSEMDTWVAHYNQFYAEELLHLYPDLPAFLTALKAHDIPVVVLTVHSQLVLTMIDQSNLQSYVDLVVGSMPYYVHDFENFRAVYQQEVVFRVANQYARRAPSAEAGAQVGLGDAMFVTCTPNLVYLGKALGAQTCYVNKTEGALNGDDVPADVMVGDLAGLEEYLFGSADEIGARSKIPRISEEVDGGSEVMEIDEVVNGEPEAMDVVEDTEVATGEATNGAVEVVTEEIME